ncbi:hypothetical protein HT136_09190 [Novosphingobium profundi]|uniref:hypothetical protein n=1 Tax=Novosphingobium profundi TaxID=1774954 RepID=UPI001BD93155|nr:hypothetical protein [Novosphingobium profundi]MBT0668542.1 hypothetical protein [Novosphingobium profundi]
MINGSNFLPGHVSFAQDLRAAGTESAAVRLLRDMALCAGGTVLGARLDGALAYFTMQSICSSTGFDPFASVAVHLALLPATSAIMALVALVCQWPGLARGQPTRWEILARWSTFALRSGLLFLAMMLAMSMMQPLFRSFVPASAASAELASVLGMVLLALLSAGLRPLALRVPFLVPFCCR